MHFATGYAFGLCVGMGIGLLMGGPALALIFAGFLGILFGLILGD